MHARYYWPDGGRFLSVDPVGGKVGSSQSWNRYSYVLNNPIVFTDPTGETVDMSGLDPFQQNLLLAKLNQFTGNAYSLNDNCELQLDEIGKNSSETATGFLGELISGDISYNVEASSGSNEWIAGTSTVMINFDSKNGMTGTKGVDTTTFNLGSTLIHELRHADTGLADWIGKPSGVGFLDWSGPVIDFVNDIRQERGLATRKAWGAQPMRGRRKGMNKHIFYLPGSKREAHIYAPRTR